MTEQRTIELPSIHELESLDQERALDMLDNRPIYADWLIADVPIHSRKEPSMIKIHDFKPGVECEYSGKIGEAVEISTDDGSIQHAVICIPELTKLLRFRYRQAEKLHANGNG